MAEDPWEPTTVLGEGESRKLLPKKEGDMPNPIISLNTRKKGVLRKKVKPF